MPSLRPRSDHQEAVSRRLALLSAELAEQHPERVTEGLPEEPALVRVPGRHADRRSPIEQPSWRGRWALGPQHLVVVAVLAAVGIGLTAWWVVRSQPRVVEAPEQVVPTGAGATLAGASPAAAEPTGGASVSTTASGSVTVDVAGRVRRPGIVVLDGGARVVDAVRA